MLLRITSLQLEIRTIDPQNIELYFPFLIYAFFKSCLIGSTKNYPFN